MWKRLDSGKHKASNTKVGSGNDNRSCSMERDSTPVQMEETSAPFPIPTTIGPLLNKWVRDNEEPICKSSPLPVKNLASTSEDKFQGRCPILEEVPSKMLTKTAYKALPPIGFDCYL